MLPAVVTGGWFSISSRSWASEATRKAPISARRAFFVAALACARTLTVCACTSCSAVSGGIQTSVKNVDFCCAENPSTRRSRALKREAGDVGRPARVAVLASAACRITARTWSLRFWGVHWVGGTVAGGVGLCAGDDRELSSAGAQRPHTPLRVGGEGRAVAVCAGAGRRGNRNGVDAAWEFVAVPVDGPGVLRSTDPDGRVRSYSLAGVSVDHVPDDCHHPKAEEQGVRSAF